MLSFCFKSCIFDYVFFLCLVSNLRIRRADQKDRNQLHEMLKAYQAELTTICKEPVNLTQCLSTYSGNNRKRFILVFEKKKELVGFCFINDHSYTGADYSITEFYIEPLYRRQSLGKHAVSQIFAVYPGKYEVRQLLKNKPAHHFWKSILSQYKGYCDYELGVTDFDGYLQVVRV